jgi:type IV pilus assembly protein PilX
MDRMMRAPDQSMRLSRRQHRKQGGIVLILALILLVVISSVAIFSVRSAISGEQVSNSIRINVAATQAAEIGLRYCENSLLGGNFYFISLPLNEAADPNNPMPTKWRNRANWATEAMVVPMFFANSADAGGRTMNNRPMCMSEEMQVQPDGTTSPNPATYLITSRGFTQDYQTNGSGVVISGSEVWMQSVLRY